ncbi:tRNA (N6-threonylcarbamoyladenosine(37)-N6)-methyltransferase TrmO [Luteococcus peritonei]|uniref:tRNA (N6-threonylcarbamoyladenosine(37)-N6)-methyltransferase TrmO n=1 Tax=Luteococcus peritonei TaxID=88874 RepID=A0ABW4RSF4_9ACTN
MTDRAPYRTIARVRTDFPSKFGVPRQAGMVPELSARVVFEPDFRDPAWIRGIEGFSHLWLVWEFSLSTGATSSTVRPPRLRGARMGVFATRAPLRPNPIGLSSVRLESVETDGPEGPVLVVSGADLVDRTPVLDLKPYIPLDCHPEATSGFIGQHPEPEIHVEVDEQLLAVVPPAHRQALLGVLRADPRPTQMHNPERVYGLPFAGLDVRFRFDGSLLQVVSITPLEADAEAAWPGYR